jgi:hypothetical protein
MDDYQEQEAYEEEQPQQELDEQPEAADGEQQEHDEDEQHEQQEDEVQVQLSQDDNGDIKHELPGPTQAVSLVYPELSVPESEPMDSLAAALALEEQLAAGVSEEEQQTKKKLEAASMFSRRVVSGFVVGAGQDGAPVARETSAMRFLSFEFENRFTLERSAFMLQGPPQTKQHVPGQYSKPAIIKSFPREEVIIGSMSQLASIDGRSSRNKEKTWSATQQAQVCGAVARLGAPVLLASGVLLSNRTVVAFPGVCTSDAAHIAIDKLDLRPAPFADIKCAKNAAVLYNEPLCSDYAHVKLQAYKIDQYAIEGYTPGKDAAPDGKSVPMPIVPRFALVHRVVGTIGEIIVRLQDELAQLEQKQRTSDTPDEFVPSIQGARDRIAELENYDASTKIDFYAYQVLDEKQSVAAYTEKLSTFGKPDSPDAQLHNCVKTLIERQNTITYTLDWTYRTISEPGPHVAFAKIALPIVPHAVFAQLQRDYVPDDAVAAPAKKGTKRSGAGVPISATLTENQVLAKQPPPTETPAPTRGVRFMEPVVIPGLAIQPTRVGVISKQPASTPTPPAKAAQPIAVPSVSTTSTTTTTTTTATTSAAAALRKVTAPSATTSAAEVARKPDAPKTAPAKAPIAKAPADGKAEQPAATAPDAKKPRSQEPAIKSEPPTGSSAVVAPQRTPEQRAMVDRLREMLPKLLTRPDAERFGVWGNLATVDSAQYASYPHPDPPANMKDALFDGASMLVYGGLAEIVLRGLSQESVPSRAPPTVSWRPEI